MSKYMRRFSKLRMGVPLGLQLFALHTLIAPTLILLRGKWPVAGTIQRMLDAPLNNVIYLCSLRLVPFGRWLQIYTDLTVGQVVLLLEIGLSVALGGILYFAIGISLGLLANRRVSSSAQ